MIFKICFKYMQKVSKNMSNFKRKQFDFPIPKLVQQSIDDLENAVITNSLSLDCYLQKFRANVHCCTDGEEGLTEEQGEELIDYYYRRKYRQ